MKTRNDEMFEQYRQYNRDNPFTGVMFNRYAIALIKQGYRNYSPRDIIAKIRWESDKPDNQGKSTFKVNNNWAAFYARDFRASFPAYGDFFKLRKQTSQDEPATNLPELTPEYFEEPF